MNRKWKFSKILCKSNICKKRQLNQKIYTSIGKYSPGKGWPDSGPYIYWSGQGGHTQPPHSCSCYYYIMSEYIDQVNKFMLVFNLRDR